MRHVISPPQVLIVEPTPVYALLSSAELDAAGFEVTLARSLEDGLRSAEMLLEPHRPMSTAILLINITTGATDHEPFPGLQLVQLLRQRMDAGLLREAVIVGLVERTTVAAEAVAQEAGCHLLQAPVRGSAAQFLRRLVAPAAFVPAQRAVGPHIRSSHAA